MRFDEYEKGGREKYKEFAKVVSRVLKSALDRAGMRVQAIQSRAKAPKSLLGKLDSQKGSADTDIESLAKDLAGCRLIFYTNSEVEAFMSSGILAETFEIDVNRTKIHHPDPEGDSPTDLFISDNYVVRLKADRTVLPEYAAFVGLQCEIQVQTGLNHAWSEMAHDTIYKPLLLSGFGGGAMKQIGARMKQIMKEYLLPAGHEFDKVARDFARLSKGKELFDQGALKAVDDASSLNELHDTITQLAKHILPHYDEPATIAAEVRATMERAIVRARTMSVVPIETPYGCFAGKSVADVVHEALEVVGYLEYVSEEAIQQTFAMLVDLFPAATSPEERQHFVKAAGELAEQRLIVWREHGPIVQKLVIGAIEKLSPEKADASWPVIDSGLQQILNTTVKGRSSKSDSITLHHGSVTPSTHLAAIRSKALSVLESRFRRVPTISERRAVFSTMDDASGLPSMSNYTDELLAMTLGDTARYVRFAAANLALMDHEFVQHLEDAFLNLYRHRTKFAKTFKAESVHTAGADLAAAILAFREAANVNPEFVHFKTLVGYKSVFPPAWSDEDFDLKEVDEYRDNAIDQAVESVSEATTAEWVTRLTTAASIRSNDGASFPPLMKFLERVGERRPEFALQLIGALPHPLEGLLEWILAGLEKVKPAEVEQLTQQWVQEGKYLLAISKFHGIRPSADHALLERIVAVGIARADDKLLQTAVLSFVQKFTPEAAEWIQKVFVPAVVALVAGNQQGWIAWLWPPPTESDIFRLMDEADARMLLDLLVSMPKVYWKHEQLIQALTQRWPESAVDFFDRRMAKEDPEKLFDHYEPIPHEFQYLDTVLKAAGTYLFDKAKGWYEVQGAAFAFRGGMLIANAYGALDDELLSRLNDVLRSGESDDADLVLQVLANHQGDSKVYPICKRVIEQFDDEDLRNQVYRVMSATGIMVGPFGRVNALKNRHQLISEWANDENPRVKSFAQQRMKEMEHDIKLEQRRSESDLAQRRLDYGEKPDIGETPSG